MEACLQGHKLLLNAYSESPLDIEPSNGGKKFPSNRGSLSNKGTSPHILLFVLIGHRDVFAIGLQIVVSNLPKSVMFHCKGSVYIAFNVVLPINAHHTHSASLGGHGMVRGIQGPL